MQRTRSPLYALATASLLFLSACGSSPADKVRQMEERNEALRESSGYNECMRLVRLDEQKIADCIKNKLTAAGYTDGLDCIMQPDNPICASKERYNTQVYAHNDCPKEVVFETELGEGDCNKMMMDAMSQ
jgi:hypothetical protein